MPELPEIETVRLQLQKVLPEKVIEKLEILNPKSFQGDPRLVEGKKVLVVGRKAKLLLIDLQGDIDLAIHFKMTGQLVFEENDKSKILNPKSQINSNNQISNIQKRIVGGHPTRDFTGELPSKHTRVIFHLSSTQTSHPTPLLNSGEGGGTLYFNDQRMFGWIKVSTKSEILSSKFVRDLGPEPFEISKDKFLKILSSLKRPIKSALMDQTVISGVGNIYANDALWESGIHPDTGCARLTEVQLNSLFKAIKKVLREGIKYGGATAADEKYIDLHGLGGHYQDHFRVYDREGEPCLRNDKGMIQKFKLGGRGTYFCPVCQK